MNNFKTKLSKNLMKAAYGFLSGSIEPENKIGNPLQLNYRLFAIIFRPFPLTHVLSMFREFAVLFHSALALLDRMEFNLNNTHSFLRIGLRIELFNTTR